MKSRTHLDNLGSDARLPHRGTPCRLPRWGMPKGPSRGGRLGPFGAGDQLVRRTGMSTCR
jgi:hypothetical protein